MTAPQLCVHNDSYTRLQLLLVLDIFSFGCPFGSLCVRLPGFPFACCKAAREPDLPGDPSCKHPGGKQQAALTRTSLLQAVCVCLRWVYLCVCYLLRQGLKKKKKKTCEHGGRVLNGNRLVCGFHSCRPFSVMGHPVNISALYFAFVYLRGSSKWFTVATLYQRQAGWKANLWLWWGARNENNGKRGRGSS